MTSERAASKAPEVTLLFWIVKVAATTLGETGGDAVSMSMKLGYLVATAVFAALFFAAVTVQIRAKRAPRSSIGSRSCSRRTLGTALGDWTADSAGPRLSRQRARLRRDAPRDRRAPLRHTHRPHVHLLGGVHPHASARGGRRRLPRQTARRRRPRAQPFRRVGALLATIAFYIFAFQSRAARAAH